MVVTIEVLPVPAPNCLALLVKLDHVAVLKRTEGSKPGS